jgi:hypothetical protein
MHTNQIHYHHHHQHQRHDQHQRNNHNNLSHNHQLNPLVSLLITPLLFALAPPPTHASPLQ